MTEPSTLRTSPIHLLFVDEKIDRGRFEAIHDEAVGSGQDHWNPLAVSALPTVSAWVSELRPGGQDPHAVHAYSSLIYYAMHVMSDVGAVWVVPEGLGRTIVVDEGPSDGEGWSESPPSAAGYIQLPHNLFWVHTATEENEDLAEPVDGVFWSSGPDDDGLWVMIAAGMRSGRPGFSAVALDRVPLRDVDVWATEQMRAEGEDFANLLPGGELAGFLTIATSGEALKLLARLWRHVEMNGSTPATDPTGLAYTVLPTGPDPTHA